MEIFFIVKIELRENIEHLDYHSYLPLECGVTTAVINLRRGLETLGHEVRILTISGGNETYEKDSVY